MPYRVIKTLGELVKAFTHLKGLRLPLTVEWKQGHDRTIAQNALQWKWACEVATQRQDVDMTDVQAEWKVRHGFPILCEASPKFLEMHMRCLEPLPYEEQVEFVKETNLQVTSSFKVKQMIEYMDAVERECVNNGYYITQPDPEMRKHHDRYRRAA